jgi:hypothetical protein
VGLLSAIIGYPSRAVCACPAPDSACSEQVRCDVRTRRRDRGGPRQSPSFRRGFAPQRRAPDRIRSRQAEVRIVALRRDGTAIRYIPFAVHPRQRLPPRAPPNELIGLHRPPGRSPARSRTRGIRIRMWGSGSTVLELDGNSDGWGERGAADGRGVSEYPMWRRRGHYAATGEFPDVGDDSVAKHSSWSLPWAEARR